MEKYTLKHALKNIFPYDIIKGEEFECEGLIFKSLGDGEWRIGDLNGKCLNIATLRVMSSKERIAGKDKNHEWYNLITKCIRQNKKK